jgi:hypothetical protein
MTSTLLLGTPEAAQNYSLGAGDPLDRFRRHFARTIRRFERPVLVVVDDLDRCEPAYVTELLRGMQTILTSPRIVFLLLGDRDWIEQAFSETHKTMKGVYVGPEHEFGARFVEKAIQFSFVLPDISREKRQSYVRRLLGLADVPEASGAAPGSGTLRARAEAVLAETDYQAREAAATRLRESEDVDTLQPEAREALLKEFDTRLSLRAAADSSAERATSHMIEALAPLLPSNPRQIKRIVNTISLMQEAARLEGMAQPGSAEWQLLARWLVIMLEWPKSYFTLSRYPGLADLVLGRAAEGELPEQDVEAYVKQIQAKPTVMSLLIFEAPERGWDKRDITSREINWLRILFPPASGRVVEVPTKKASAESAQ